MKRSEGFSTDVVLKVLDCCYEEILEMFDNMPENVRSAIILALEKIEDPDGKKAKSSGMFSWIKH